MFGVSFTELIVIGVVILIVFGPERLPEVARNLGRMLGQLKRSSDEFKKEIIGGDKASVSVGRELHNELRSLKSELLNPLNNLTTTKSEEKDNRKDNNDKEP